MKISRVGVDLAKNIFQVHGDLYPAIAGSVQGLLERLRKLRDGPLSR